jgi:hypothetical protein
MSNVHKITYVLIYIVHSIAFVFTKLNFWDDFFLNYTLNQTQKILIYLSLFEFSNVFSLFIKANSNCVPH